MRKRLSRVVLTALTALTLTVAGPTAAAQAPQSTCYLQAELTITNSGQDAVTYLRMEVPLVMRSSAYGMVTGERFSLQPVSVIEDEHGQRMGVFEVNRLEPGQKIVLVQRYDVAASPQAVTGDYVPAAPQDKVETEHEEIQAVAKKVTAGKVAGRERVQAILDYIVGHVQYRADSQWRNEGALSALKTREGVCEDFAALFVAMSRASGLQARLVYGYRGQSTFERHAWAEVLVDGSWTGVDPSYGPQLGLAAGEMYVAQWYRDIPIRIRFAGGKLSATLSEQIGR